MSGPATTAESLTESMIPMAREIVRCFPSRGVCRDDIRSEAYLSLWKAASLYMKTPDVLGNKTLEEWLGNRIRNHIKEYVRSQLFPYLADVPFRLKRLAIKIHVTTDRLKARGILRPSFEHIAQEANTTTQEVFLVSVFTGVIVRQSSFEHCEDHAKPVDLDAPKLEPVFGPQPGFTPLTPCQDVIQHPIRKGSVLCCMVCHKSGVDDHSSLKRSRATDPPPESKSESPPIQKRPADVENRKERRLRLFQPMSA